MIYRVDLQRNPTAIYLFGDNEARVGKGGQAAEMRGEPNAVGIRTKRLPGYEDYAYWSDDNYVSNCEMIEEDTFPIIHDYQYGRIPILVIPADGIGTGLAELATRAPRTLAFLNSCMRQIESVTVKPGYREDYFLNRS